MMGTLWTIEAVSPDGGGVERTRQAVEAAYAELARIDQMMSEWKPASPISQVNAAAGKHPVAVPAELRDMILRSKAYTRESEGAFDITWRGMGRIWRFDDEFRVPSKEEVAVARRRIDSRRIQVQGDEVYLPEAEMSIGLGGIAKGYAVDRAMQVLVDLGIRNALVNGGGDVVVRGSRLGQPWRLGIQHPRKEHGELLGALELRGQALVTSGDYERYQMANGIRYHHIIDPRTGWPASASMSVTVISPTAELGVVLAKVLFILGPERGLRLAQAKQTEALLIDSEGREHRTPGFPPLN
jgi:thiamine biosynthesis lipoprotein